MLVNPIAAFIKLADSSSVVFLWHGCSDRLLPHDTGKYGDSEEQVGARTFNQLIWWMKKISQKPIVVRGYNAVFQTHSLPPHPYWETVQIVVILISQVIRKSRNPRFLSVLGSHICAYRKFLDQTRASYSPLLCHLLIMATIRCFRRHSQNSHKIMGL